MACGCSNGGGCSCPFPWAKPKSASVAMPASTWPQLCPPGTRATRLSRFGQHFMKCIAQRTGTGGERGVNPPEVPPPFPKGGGGLG